MKKFSAHYYNGASKPFSFDMRLTEITTKTVNTNCKPEEKFNVTYLKEGTDKISLLHVNTTSIPGV